MGNFSACRVGDIVAFESSVRGGAYVGLVLRSVRGKDATEIVWWYGGGDELVRTYNAPPGAVVIGHAEALTDGSVVITVTEN